MADTFFFCAQHPKAFAQALGGGAQRDGASSMWESRRQLFVVPGYTLRVWLRSCWLLHVDPRQYIMTTTDELLARLVNLESEAVQARQRQSSAKHAVGSSPTTYPTVILMRRCNQHVSRSDRHTHSWQTEVVRWSNSRMDNMAILVQGIRVRSASEDEGSLRLCYTERLRACGHQ